MSWFPSGILKIIYNDSICLQHFWVGCMGLILSSFYLKSSVGTVAVVSTLSYEVQASLGHHSYVLHILCSCSHYITPSLSPLLSLVIVHLIKMNVSQSTYHISVENMWICLILLYMILMCVCLCLHVPVTPWGCVCQCVCTHWFYSFIS